MCRSLFGFPADAVSEYRRLLAIDTLVAGGLVFLYLPLYHQVWAFLLLLIIFGSTQDRQAAFNR